MIGEDGRRYDLIITGRGAAVSLEAWGTNQLSMETVL